MNSNSLAAISLRHSILTMCALWMCALAAQGQSPASVINGVYNGSYTCAQGPRDLKLSLLGSGNGLLTGVFTFYMPPGSHAKAFSYRLSGTFDTASGKFRLDPIKWETPPPANYVMVGMDGVFDPAAGRVAGKITNSSCNAFQATRDQASAANIASQRAPQEASESPRPIARPAPSTAQSPGTSITGVYNGTLSCSPNEAKIKLALIGRADNTVTGFLILDLPHDVGSQGIYRAEGRYAWGTGQFSLTGAPIGTPAPREFSMTQVKGSYSPGSAVIAGRAMNSSCDFHAERSVTETPEAVAEIAQKGPAPWTAPASPSAAAIATYRKQSQPAIMASTGLVRKSGAYWAPYQTEMIRQIFDGGFGDDMDASVQFRLLFNSYVESFSTNCRSYLPAHHETVKITQVNRKTDRYGNVTSEETGQATTVEVDSRFASKYRRYFDSLTSSAQGLASTIGIMSGRERASAYFAPGLDINRFFKTETCQSAAIRQLGENLLRAARAERSLQETGATITGAAAESDKNLPAGRFTHFVDGCNAFYRDPANARIAPSDAGGFCSCLADQYRGVMTTEEEYFYANDFGRRFRNEIAQPRELAKDPAWPRLHSAVDKCRR